MCLKASTFNSSKLIKKLSEDKNCIYFSLFIYAKSHALSLRYALFFLSHAKITGMGHFMHKKIEKNRNMRHFTRK